MNTALFDANKFCKENGYEHLLNDLSVIEALQKAFSEGYYAGMRSIGLPADNFALNEQARMWCESKNSRP